MAGLTTGPTTGLTTGLTTGPTPLIDGCQGCGACLLTCPESAIRPDGGSLVVLEDRCTGCGECIEVCPVDAITWKEGTP